MASYLRKLEADVPRWVEAGWVTREGGASLLADAETRAHEGWFRLPVALAILGGLLVFCGVVSLIAANWGLFPRAAKLVFPLGWMTLSFLAAHVARQRGSHSLSEGLALMGTLMFGASIMLIGQIYHLPPNPAGGFLLWALGAAFVSILWPSAATAGLAILLAGLWSFFASTGSTAAAPFPFSFLFADHNRIHGAFFLLWVPLVALSLHKGWRVPMHVAGFTLVGWSVMSSLGLFQSDVWRLWGVWVAVLLLLMHATGFVWPSARPGLRSVVRYLCLGFGLWLLMISAPELAADFIKSGPLPPPVLGVLGGVFALSVGALLARRHMLLAGVGALASLVPLVLPPFWRVASPAFQAASYDGTLWWASAHAGPSFILLSVATLAAGLGSILYGYHHNDRFFVNSGFKLFGLKLVWIYFSTVWLLSSRAGWMIVGGVLVIALGVAFDRQRRKVLARMGQKESAA